MSPTAAGRPDRPLTARLERFLVANVERTDRALDRLLPATTVEPRALHEAMRYGVLGGGKRLRPALVELAFRAAGGRGPGARPAACAIELVHAFSLVHDDLPCLDDDDERRGRPTVHRRYGEANALLAGDALLALAFEALRRIRSAEARSAIITLLAGATGSRGMIGGQALEEAVGEQATESDLREVHRLKTGRLFEASAGMGALAAEAPPATIRAFARYGRTLGLAFQIADDLLDLDEPDSLSYPQKVGIPRAEEALRRAGRTAQRICRLAGGPAPSLRPSHRRSLRPSLRPSLQLMADLADYVVARGLAHGY